MRKTNYLLMGMFIFSLIALIPQTHSGSAAVAAPASPSALPAVVEIGFLYPATGDLGSIGQGLLDGAMAAAYRLNQTYAFNVTLKVEDTKTVPADAKTAAQNLVSGGVEIIIGGAASSSTIAASEVTIANEVPLISYASTSPAITALDDNDYVFRVVASDVFQGVALAELAKNQSVTSAYVMNRDDAYGNGVADEFEKAFVALGGTIVGSIAYDPAATSYASEVGVVKASTADGVVLVAFPEDANKIFAQFQTDLVVQKFFGTDGIATGAVTNVTGTRDYLNGNGTTAGTHLYGTTPASGTNPGTGSLFAQYTADLASTGGSAGVFGDYSYDAVLLAGAALNATQEYDGVKLRDALYVEANGLKGATGADKALNCAGEPVSQAYDYWNATDYSTTTQVARAVDFPSIAPATDERCGLTIETNVVTTTQLVPTTVVSTVTTTVATPGFELLSILGLVALLAVLKIKKQSK